MIGEYPADEHHNGLPPVLTIRGVPRPDGEPPELVQYKENHAPFRAIRCPVGSNVTLIEVSGYAEAHRILHDTARFGVENVDPDVTVTGAERASSNGGTLRSDKKAFHKAIEHLFSAKRVEQTWPEVAGSADDAVDTLPLGGVIDFKTYSEPLMADLICHTLGLPEDTRETDWARMLSSSRNAFGYTHDIETRDLQDAAWDDIELFFAEILAEGRHDETGAIGQIAKIFEERGFTTDQLIKTLSVFANGAPAALVAMDRLVVELARRPYLIAEGLRFPDQRAGILDDLMVEKAHFPLDVTRAAKERVELGGQTFEAGTIFLNSVTAVVQSRQITGRKAANFLFGEGDHFCLGTALTRLWLDVGLWKFFEAYPEARLAVPSTELAWNEGTLSIPEQIPLVLGGKVPPEKRFYAPVAK